MSLSDSEDDEDDDDDDQFMVVGMGPNGETTLSFRHEPVFASRVWRARLPEQAC